LAIVAYNYGARKPDRIVKTIRCGCFAASAMMAVGLLIFQLFPETLLGFFNPNEALLKVGVPTLRTLSLPFILAGICIIFGNVFQAMGKSIYSMITSIARQIGVLIPAAYLLSLTDNMDAVWYAFPIAEIASLTASIWMMLSIYRKKIRPLRDSACNSQNEVV
jgi:Na+-driven multidrug efflux pump